MASHRSRGHALGPLTDSMVYTFDPRSDVVRRKGQGGDTKALVDNDERDSQIDDGIIGGRGNGEDGECGAKGGSENKDEGVKMALATASLVSPRLEFSSRPI